jgi:hypothetical protein
MDGGTPEGLRQTAFRIAVGAVRNLNDRAAVE